MKKFLITVFCILAIIAGGLLLWKVVFPFLGSIFGWFFGGLVSLF